MLNILYTLSNLISITPCDIETIIVTFSVLPLEQMHTKITILKRPIVLISISEANKVVRTGEKMIHLQEEKKLHY